MKNFTQTKNLREVQKLLNRKSYLAFLTIFLFLMSLVSIGQTFEFAKQLGGASSNKSQSIATDVFGNIYTTGHFTGTVDFNPGTAKALLTSKGNDDVFISKVDASGNFVWVKHLGGSSYEYGESITTDAFGNVYTTGYFAGTVDFNPGYGVANLTAVGNRDVFVLKLNSSGNFVWAKQLGGINSIYVTSVSLDAFGNVLTIGRFEGTADFDPGIGVSNLTSVGSSDIFISKLDNSGNFVWAKQMGGLGKDFGESIATDASGNVYTTGYFYGTADFDPGAGVLNLTSSGPLDMYISKLDVSGNFVWVKQIGSTSVEYAQSIAVDNLGNVFTTGNFYGTVDFDPGTNVANLSNNGGVDVFVLKLDDSGNYLWAKQMGGSGKEYGQSITTDVSGNVYTTGIFSGTSDFDPGVGTSNLTSAGDQDIFVSKLDGLGNFVWAKHLGGTEDDFGQSIATDINENVYTTGYFSGTSDFDPGTSTSNLSALGNDIFISKLNISGGFEWAKQLGGASSNEGQSISTDASGNIYTTGHFSGTVDFDPGAGKKFLTSKGNDDIFISKVDALGNFVWVKQLGGPSYEYGESITTDASGNIYTTGYFAGKVDFNPGYGVANLTAVGNRDVFVLKLDPSGNFVWAKQLGGINSIYVTSITLDASGNVYTIGQFEGTADFDPGTGISNLTSAGSSDIFISKLDNSGNFVWAKQMGGSNKDFGQSIATDASGNVYTTGYFYGTADFDPGASSVNLISSGSLDMYISKLDASGNFVWVKQIGSTSVEYPQAITVDNSGDVYTTGHFLGKIDFDPGINIAELTSGGNVDVFILKLDGSGNYIWAKQIGGSSLEHGESISTDTYGNVYTTGVFSGTTDFDPGAGTSSLTALGGKDIFISKLDVSGNFVWAKQLGGTEDDYGQSITVDVNLNVHTTGYFSGTSDFDPGVGMKTLTAIGNTDIFISKLSQLPPCANSDSTININVASTYTSPSGKSWTSTGVYFDTITNHCGFDSLMIIKLTVTDPATPNVWGTTSAGGASSRGTIFKLKKDGNDTVMYSFVNDYRIYGGLEQLSNGNIYGIGYDGNLYKFDPVANSYSIEYTLPHVDSGSIPLTALTKTTNGRLFGITSKGGLNNEGVIFEFNPITKTYSKKADFSPTGSSVPNGKMTELNGKLYGIASVGGANSLGAIYEYDPATNTLSIAYDLLYATGRTADRNTMTAANGKLYGSLSGGGNGSGKGVLFEFDPAAANPTTLLHIFNTSGSEGAKPKGSVVVKGDNIYGTTQSGGAHNFGTLYEYNTLTNTLTVLVDFNSYKTGANPEGGLLEASNGVLYGTTTSGGINNLGLLFEYDLTKSEYVVKEYLDGATGTKPKNANLIEVCYPSYDTISKTVPTNYSSPSGKSWTSTGVYFDTIPNTTGCDSLMIIKLTVTDPATPNIWGTTANGGANSKGTIFKIKMDGNDTLMHSFTAPYSRPNGGLVQLTNGDIYGIDYAGKLYKFDPVTNTQTLEYSISGVIPYSEGRFPEAALTVTSTGKLFGTASLGGANNKGVIFEYNPVTKTYLNKIDFTSSLGDRLYGKLTEANGKLYGLARTGGSNNQGSLYEYDPVTNAVTVKKDLIYGIGSYAERNSMVLSAAGNLVGTIAHGGQSSGKGVLFEFNPTTSVYSVLHIFDATGIEGAKPKGSIVSKGDKIYGTTQEGGANNFGTIYEYNTATSTLTVLVDLDSLKTGANPEGGLLEATNGILYGTTTKGGVNGKGLIFEYDLTKSEYVVKEYFDGSNGETPRNENLIEICFPSYDTITETVPTNYTSPSGKSWTSTGVYFDTVINASGCDSLIICHLTVTDPATPNIWSMTSKGGGNTGTIIKLKEDGNDTVMFTFPGGGYSPNGSLTQLSNGMIYGLTTIKDGGHLFQFNPVTNVYTDKFTFALSSKTANGTRPYGSLTQSSVTSMLYGLTSAGGTSDKGTLFEWNPITDTYTKKFDFGTSNGENPVGSLREINGELYGLTSKGNSGRGVIFKYNPSTNVFTKLHDNTYGSGFGPTANGVIEGTDGNIYGTQENGGASSGGVIFKLDPVTNVYTEIHGFSSSNGLGYKPQGNVIEISGKLYGVTQVGGANNNGAIYEYEIATSTYSLLFSFDDIKTGKTPKGGLFQASNGVLYGLTSYGGIHNNNGLIYEYDLTKNEFVVKEYFDGTNGKKAESSEFIEICDTSSFKVKILECYSYTAPSGRTFYSTGNYLDTILNAAGCDSITFIDLTIGDTTKPIPACHDTIIYLDNSGTASLDSNSLDNGSTDNCGDIFKFETSQTTFTCNDLGINTVTITVYDSLLNTSTCTSTVTVSDTTSPKASCQNITVFLDGAGTTSIVASDIDNGSTDNCSIVTLSASNTSFTCADLGANTVILTVTDGSGNTSTCNATVTVTDTTSPTASCQNITVFLDGAGAASIVASDIDNGSTDNCSTVTLSASNTSFTCADLGVNTVILTVTDGSGNTSTCNATVTVTDTTSPTASCQNITVFLDGAGTTSIVASDIDNGSTDNCSIVTLSASNTSFTCADLGVNTVILTVTDGSGNTSTCNATVTVTDTTSPTASCQNITVFLDGAGAASIVASDIDNGSTDNCSTVTLSASNTSFTCADLGVNTVILTVTDGSGNTSTCNATVTVTDTTSPTASCQNITVFLDGAGTTSIVASDIDNGSTDNCSIVTLSASNTSFTCADLGANTVILTVTDGSGNTSTCNATVTVTDTTSPTASCQNITVFLDGAGAASIVASDIDNGSTDNCSTVTLSASNTSFTCADLGVNTVILTVTDGSGNTSTCNATVTVTDTTSPTASCQNITVFLDGAGAASIVASDIDNGSTDNCSTVTLSASNTSFTCADLGANTVILTVTDGSGNTSTCNATVTVKDNTSPIAVCKNITVYLDATGNASIDSNSVDGGSTDNCGISKFETSKTEFVCSDSGVNNVVLTVTDKSGNVSTCNATVTVIDSVPPVVICKDTIIYFDSLGTVSIDSSFINFGSNDVCGINSMSLSQSTFSCDSNIGANTILLTVTDVNGNSATCSSVVTILDTIKPVASCKIIVVNLDSSGMAVVTPDLVDDGSYDNCEIEMSLDKDTFYCKDVGVNFVTLTVKDASGNTSTCKTYLTVVDTVKPKAFCKDFTAYIDSSGLVKILASDINNNSSDNCSIDLLSLSRKNYSCSDLGVNPITLTVFDSYGNISDCNSILTIKDTIKPIALCKNITVYLDANGMVSIDSNSVDGGSSDNCGIVKFETSKTNFTCSDSGVNNVVLTITDASGNVSTCNAIVTVKDNTAPIAQCTNVTVYLDVFGMASIDSNSLDAGSTDNCGIAKFEASKTNFACTDLGVNNVTLTVTDVSGNSSTCTATVTVVDVIPPVAISKLITVYLDEFGVVNLDSNFIDNGSTDNCGIASFSMTKTSFNCMNKGINDVLLTVTDKSGNKTTSFAVITVKDSSAPIVQCQNITVYLDANGTASIDSNSVDNGTTDNCAIAKFETSKTNFTCSDAGVNNVVLTVTDVNGNSATCNATVTVIDNIAPLAVCQNITVYLNANGTVDLDSNSLDGGSTDNCEIAKFETDVTSFTCSDSGVNNVTLTVTDVNGNSSSCIATVTVKDNTAPIAQSTNITVYLDANGTVSIDSNSVDGGSTDNCGIAKFETSKTTFLCSDSGINNVVLTVTDASGNSSISNAIVTVKDNIVPVFSNCPADFTVSVNKTGCNAETNWIAPTVTDNCGIASLTSTHTIGQQLSIGSHTITYTAVDKSGNTSTCSFVVTVENNSLFTQHVTACDTKTINGKTYTTSQVVKDTLLGASSHGCDSIVITNLTIINSTTGVDVQVACDSYTWMDGVTYTASNTSATMVLTNSVGCDSIVTLNLTINESTTYTDVQTACNSYTWINGVTYTANNNTAKDTLTNSVGCDSVVTLNLTINPIATSTDVQVACDSYTWIDGVTYTASNTSASVTLTNSAGCDSVVTLSLTINHTKTFTDVQLACDSYLWINGVTYTANNNTAKDTLVSSTGCDSIITLDLTIKHSTSSTFVHTGCGSYTWIDGVTYTPGTNINATFIIPNSVGCDSVITLNLTFQQTTYYTDVQTSCGLFTWINGVTYSANNSVATYIMNNAAGCDSVITLDLTVTSINNTVSVSANTLTSGEAAATSYQWLDCDAGFAPIAGATERSYSPTRNGKFSVEITKDFCTDTSSCSSISSVGIEEDNSLGLLNIYPNPNNGEFTILFDEMKSDIELTMYTAAGKLVFKEKHSTATQIKINKVLASGMYYIVIQDKDSKVIKPVVIR